MNLFIKFSLLLFVSLSISVSAQSNQVNTDSLSIENQFEYLIQKSGKYKNNRVIKKNKLFKLKSNTLDTLEQLKSSIKLFENDLKEKNTKIESLESNLVQVESELENTQNKKSSMSLFGLILDKVTYNIILWSIVGVLILILSLVSFKFSSARSLTKSAKSKLADLEEEYENHRRNALEREQKVRRQLQDEINKNKSSK